MTARSVDFLNIGLMLVSCALAFAFPFELFLFSFAVLGPLHYFTEIPWLHDKRYFTTGKRDYLVIVALAMIIAFAYFSTPVGGRTSQLNKDIMAAVTFAIFFAALAFAVFKKTRQKWLFIAAVAITSLFVARLDVATQVFANLLPSIIHVYVFTAGFILLGALKHKSITGIVSLVVFAACTALFFLLQPLDVARPSEYIVDSYAPLASLNLDMLDYLGLANPRGMETGGMAELVFLSPVGIMVMRLIAFSYTYHFLNWFSKTSIIKWHEVARKRSILILALWVGSVVLYASNYAIGMRYLYILSLLHVVLEYPLNHRTFIGIGEELRKLFSSRRSAPLPAES
jgi:hypothetical protein